MFMVQRVTKIPSGSHQIQKHSSSKLHVNFILNSVNMSRNILIFPIIIKMSSKINKK